jgi:hypothetical protein
MMTDLIDSPEAAMRESSATNGTIRPFDAADAPRVAEILLYAFQHSTRPPSQEMVNYIRHLYLEIPWSDPNIYARVMELPDGRISGFIGLTPLPLQMGDKRIKVGVTSSLSVDSRIGDAMTGPRLIRDVRNGPQDGVFSDRSNLAAAAMSRQIQSEVLHNYSQEFIRILRPAGFGLQKVSQHFGAARHLYPLLAPLDRRVAANAFASDDGHWGAPGKTRGSTSFKDRNVSVDEVLDLLPHFLERYTLRPDFEREHWRYILKQGSQKRKFGTFHAVAVDSPSGETIGLYMYHARKGGTAELFQAFANPGREGVVLDRLLGHAMDQGAVAVHGRSTPTFHNQLIDRRAFFYPDLWTIVYAPDKEVARHFHAGTALFTGSVGENWIRLNGDV